MKESYTIQISEVQRKIILDALEVLQGSPIATQTLKAAPGDMSHGGYETAYEELNALHSMLIEMPNIEDTHTTIHGLCL